ncbi:GNAT family N-acetyltransferase [Piscibacillus sp. B03]|uniref:GNAT family N-acetyltransferase n=1 Tax=Piscibacillus sp. B03 TaxID=3457430 RepID=UPI003FCCC5D6
MSIKVRHANEADVDELLSLNYAFNGVENLTRDFVIDHLRSSNELVVVASLNNRLVGFICGQVFSSFCYKEKQAEITELFVVEEARRNGVATALLKYLEEEFKEVGVETVKVLAGDQNLSAKKVYQKNYYKIDDVLTLHKNFE